MRSLVLVMSVLVCCRAPTITAQIQMATVRVHVRAADKPVEGAEVVVAGTTHRTDAAGTTTIVTMPGTVDITVLKPGFAAATASVHVAAGATQDVVVELQAQPTARGDRHRRGVDSHRQETRGSADARRGPGSRRDRREDAHDARRHRHDAERNGRHAGAGDVAVARRRQRPHSGHARPVHACALRRVAAVR